MRHATNVLLAVFGFFLTVAIGCGSSTDPDPTTGPTPTPTPSPSATPTPTPTPCTPAVDQVGPGGTFGRVFGCQGCYRDVGQTVTVGLGGTLERFDVLSIELQAGADPLVLEVRGVAGGLPDESPAALLGTTSVPAAALPTSLGTVSFDLSGLAIPVSVGQSVAFVLRASGNEMGIQTSGADNYAGGQGVQFDLMTQSWSTILDRDLGFEVRVCTP
jgi:hypothetical protein